MTFYIDDKNEKIIKNYKKENNSFIIEYLDGTKDYIKESDTTLDDIHLKMIKQAIKRDRLLYNKTYLKIILNSFYECFGLFASGFAMSNKNFFMLIISLILWVFMSEDNNKNSIKLRELKKYRLFLRLLNSIEEIEDLELEYVDDDEKQKPLTINELDKITYKEMIELDNEYKLMLKNINNENK